MIRFFDYLISLMGLIILMPLLILIWIIGLIENGSPLFKQKRVGYNQKFFTIIKFRTMNKNTKFMATHLVSKSNITKFGSFLRFSKLDEIPQLWNVIKGEMSIVGPRPCLLNQKKLISERKKRKVFKKKPGITGLAQISGVTMKTPILLAKIDEKMNKNMSLYYYFYYITKTALRVFKLK